MTKEPPLLKIENLQKSYSGKPVVNGLDFEVNKGEVVGLLGPNGAGKSTTIFCLLGLIIKQKTARFRMKK